MTKRSLERDVDAVSDEVLRALAPGERLQAMLEAHARDRERWLDRLWETCPPEQTWTVAAYCRLALLSALEGVYTLHTTALYVKLLETKQQAVASIDYYRDDPPTEERLDRAADRATDIRALFATLYITYHSSRRFAADHLGSDLETWFALHRDGERVVVFVEEVLDDPTEQRLAAKWLAEDAEGASDTPTDEILDAFVDRQYEALVTMWNDPVTPGPRSRR